MICLASLASTAPAQTLSTLWNFTGSTGQFPSAPLTLGADANFYGTTSGPNTYIDCGGGYDGSVFKITPTGVLTTLYAFSAGGDICPYAALTLGANGNFYGTTALPGGGAAFEITPAGVLNNLYSFDQSGGGFFPVAALTLGTDGNFYGTTTNGGPNACETGNYYGCGTVFRITPAGTLTTLHNFTGPDGSVPEAALTLGPDGNFYGTTSAVDLAPALQPCMYDCGTVFQITSSGTLTSLYSFSGPDGAFPAAPLTLGNDGNFYGTTSGVSSSDVSQCVYTCGTVFKITPTGSLTNLYAFTGPDGANPFGALLLGSNGNFYGTTEFGGVNGLGTIFEMTPSGVLTTLHSFSGPDGEAPVAGLILGPDGNFYGTTESGGTLAPAEPGGGTVFRWCLPGANKVCTTTALSSTLNPSTPGATVTITATVVPAGPGTATGSVTFTDGGTLLASVALADGVASLTTATLSLGYHTIEASYSGDPNFQISSSFLLQTVDQAATTTTVTSNLNPSAYNQSLKFTATVSALASSGEPTGTITFKNGSRTLGSVTLSGGSASLAPPVLAAGTDSITAAYSGDTDHLASTGSLSQVIDQATTMTVIKSSDSIILVNQQVTFTATVTGLYGGDPTGTVTFSANGAQIGSPVAVASRVASVITSFAAAGAYSITAVYSGDTNFVGGNAAPLSETVDLTLPTTTTLKSSGSPSTVGNSVTFTATVRPSSGTIPNGEVVTFYDGASSIGTGITSAGAAALSTSSLPVGTNSITATYSGDSVFQGSTSAAVKQVVNKQATTTTLASSINPSTYGQSVTFTAKVSSSGPAPTGTVTFKNGSAPIGTGTLAGGAATLTYSKLAAGTNSITAAYNGDANSSNSTSVPLSQTVTEAATATAVASSKNPSNSGQSVTFTATVTSAYATPTGTVTFTQGSTTLGAATLAGGKAKLAVTTLPAGSDTVIATFGGGADFAGSSGSIVQTVN
ncbi:MAG: Ig-like domain repeat protein [Bryobacteraceae bacterium]